MSYKYNQNPNKQFKDGRTPVKDYLKSKEFREQRLWSMVNGILVTQVGNDYLTLEEFDEKFKPFNPVHFKLNPGNADKTRSYLI